MTRTSGRFWLGLVIAAYTPTFAADAQEPTSAQAMAAALIGSWTLQSWTLANGSPRCSEEEGRVSGLLVYTSDGHMSVQLGCSEIDVGDLSGLSPQQVVARLSRRHFTYYGPYTVDAAAQAVTHHVEGSSSEGFVGSDQVRPFVLEGRERLVLSPEGSGQRLVWLRNR